MKIVADADLPFLNEYFGCYGDITKVPGRKLSAADVNDADILLVRSVTYVDEKLLSGSSVKFVGSMTAGADHLDRSWLKEANIAYESAAGFNAPPVADYLISTVAALMQRRLLPLKKWRAAVIGVGNVGKLVVDKLRMLGAEVLLCDPLRALSEPDFATTQLSDIHDVDLITLHVPLTAVDDYPTFHMINGDFLKRQKAGCVLVNASRGAVIDSKALLKEGGHLTWCLDVFENEPEIDKTILERALLATPHIAGYSVQSKIRGMEMLYEAACRRGIIEKQATEPMLMPQQELHYSGNRHRWQDIVLGAFNPAVTTAMMRTSMLNKEYHGDVFDELRRRFQYRHEFAYTRIPGLMLPNEDIRILAHLGFNLSSV